MKVKYRHLFAVLIFSFILASVTISQVSSLQTWETWSPNFSSQGVILTEAFEGYLYDPDVVHGGTLTAQASTTYEIVLFEGWNLIGLPCIPEDPSIKVVLADILENVRSVWAFDGEMKTWSSYAPEAPSDLTEMVEDKGYWIYMEKSDILTVRGIYSAEEGIVTEVEGPLPGTKAFIYTTEEYQISVIVPTCLEVSTPDNKSKSEIYVYLKPLVSLSGSFSVDIEFGVKVKFPVFGIYLFTDVDASIFGVFKPDIIQMEWLVYGVPLQYIDLEEGDVGLYSISIPTKSGIVSLESLTVGDWNYIAAYDIYTVMEPIAVSLGLTPDEIIVEPVELVEP